MEILQTYQRESKPIGDVYAQVTQLFHEAPDLLQDFKQFLPESAAQAKAQAQEAQAAKQTEDAVMLSNVRGEFATGVQHVQANTPRPEMKMPPVGNFAPPSATKENKKRRGGPVSGSVAAIDIGAGSSSQGTRIGGRGNASKVSQLIHDVLNLLQKPINFLCTRYLINAMRGYPTLRSTLSLFHPMVPY